MLDEAAYNYADLTARRRPCLAAHGAERRGKARCIDWECDVFIAVGMLLNLGCARMHLRGHLKLKTPLRPDLHLVPNFPPHGRHKKAIRPVPAWGCRQA